MPTETAQDERYTLLEQLGKGGMGVVWRARDTVLERDVAVKEIYLPPPVDGDTEAIRTRALREARAAARTAHPAVTRVFDVESTPERVRIVMELVEADTLTQRVARDGALSPREAARLGLDVLDALSAAHREGVVHRDVKPANIMVGADGRGKLTDFGVATLRDQPQLTAAGQVIGSPAYMAPEQARDGTASPSSDLWSLGATLYFAVEGRPPFDGGQPMTTMASVLEETPSHPDNAGPLEPILTALLTKQPQARPDADTVRGLLERVLTAPEDTEPVDETARQPHRWRHAAIAGALVVVLGLAGGALASMSTFGGQLSAPEDGTGVGPDGDGGPQRPDAPPQESGDNPPPPPDDGSAEDGSEPVSAATAEGWTTYTDEELGYSLQVPADWEVVPLRGDMTDFRDPASPTYLRVDYTSEPPESAVGAWEDMSASFASSREGYEELRIQPTTYQGFRAAVWEYRYTEGGVTLHAVNLGFGNDQFGHALNFVTAEDDWRASQETFRVIQRGFQPARSAS